MEVNYGAGSKEDEPTTTTTTTTETANDEPTRSSSSSVVPRDSEGYHQSFKLNDSNERLEPDESEASVLEAAKAFFKQHGFVVFRDAVPPPTVEGVIDDIWRNYLFEGIRRDDPSTWFLRPPANWNSTVFGGSYNTKRGFLGYKIAQSQAAWNVRQSPSLYRAFAAILEETKLKVKLDRYGLMRPTKVRVPRAEEDGGGFVVEDHPEWKTEERWVHWDQNPWTEPNFRGVQGLLALSEHNETSGGFHCVPDFAATEFKEWGQLNEAKKTNASLVDLPKSDPAMSRVERICMRPGSLLIWDSRTPHGNYPNEGFDWRMVMYVTMETGPEDDVVSQADRDYLLHFIRGIELTPHGQRVARLADW